MRNDRFLAGFMGEILGIARASGRAQGWVVGLLVALGLAATGPAGAAEPQPLDPQPGSASLEAGLSVEYYWSFFREIEDFEYFMEDNKGEAVAQLPALN